LLRRAELNIAAPQARTPAKRGLAAATDDPILATQAAQAFTQLQRGTRAAGVVADSVWLLDAIPSSCATAAILAHVIPVVRHGRPTRATAPTSCSWSGGHRPPSA